MRKSVLLKAVFVMALVSVSGSASAQGFLKKLGKVAKQATTTATTDDASSSTPIDELTSTSTEDVKTIAWDSIPNYKVVKINITDENNVPIKTAVGTDSFKILLSDQFGNLRSMEVVEAQHKQLKDQINAIWSKVGVGAASGALTGLVSGKGLKGAAIGAGAGAFTGVLASLGNISNVKKMRKDIKAQDKALEAYEQNITEEGDLKDASVDPTKIKDLGLDKDENNLSMTASKLKAELSSAEYNNADNAQLDQLVDIVKEASKEKS